MLGEAMLPMALPPLGFLGAGKMATALARGVMASGAFEPEDIIISDVASAAAERRPRGISRQPKLKKTTPQSAVPNATGKKSNM